MANNRSDVKPSWFALDLTAKGVDPEVTKLSELQDKARDQLRKITADFEAAVRRTSEKALRAGAAEAVKAGSVKPETCDPENGEMIFGYNFGKKSIAFVKPTAKSTSKNTLKLG